MSTKKTTTNTTSFNPVAEQAYNSMQPVATNALMSEISDPFSNMFFNNQLAMGQKYNNAQASSAMSAALQRSQAMGQGTNSGLLNWNMMNATRNAQANNSNLFNNLLLNAGQLRQQAIGGAMSYQPQVMGSTQVQQTSGLGTWLPQVAGAGLSLATGGLGGVFGGALKHYDSFGYGSPLASPASSIPGLAAPQMSNPGGYAFDPSNPFYTTPNIPPPSFN